MFSSNAIPNKNNYGRVVSKKFSTYYINKVAKSLFVINKSAKTLKNPQFLYILKTKVISKLLSEGYAFKKGLHISPDINKNLKYDVLVVVNNYHFHIPATEHDLNTLPYLGKWKNKNRNPKCEKSLVSSFLLLINYLKK